MNFTVSLILGKTRVGKDSGLASLSRPWQKLKMRRLLVTFILLVCTPNFGMAWGELGHQVVADIAVRNLSRQAAVEVNELLGGTLQAMVQVSGWADTIIGDRPATYPWHVVQIPRDGLKYNRERDCQDDDCIVEQISKFARLLGDRTIEKSLRVEALKFLIHFVGDLHMPLHAFVGLNRYGDGAWVRIGESTEKLHIWWDERFVDALGFKASELAKTLAGQISETERKQWEGGTSEDWANESFQITYDFVTKYGLLNLRWDQVSKDKPVILPTSVLDEAKPIVVQRLKMAGVRLAWLLNQALK